MKIILLILSILLTVYLVLSLFILVFGEKLAYPAPEPSYKQGDLPEQFFIGDMAALYIDNGAEYTILYSHGNGEDLGRIYPLLQRFASLGFNLLAYDYSGYGLTKGSPSEANVYANVESAYAYLREQRAVPADKIVVVGFSMGSAASTYIASKEPAKALVLISAFASAQDAIFGRQLLPFNFLKNIDKIDKVKCPVLFIHGTKDNIVRYCNGEKMYAKCKSPKEFLTIKGASHNDIFYYDEDMFWNKLKEFKANL